jgi:thiamine biosynthesis lipoprotein
VQEKMEGDRVTHCRCFAILAGVLATAVTTAGVSSADDGRQQGAPSELARYEFLQIRMAAPVHLTVYAPSEAVANQASQAAYARIKQFDRLLSHYDPDSELSRVARDAVPGQPAPVSRELFTVLAHAERVSARTGGAFDVTVGPLMDLWRTARRKKRLPDAATLEQARQLVGHHLLRLDGQHQTVTFEKRGMRLDLGGIAKGFAADEALRVLKAHGIDRALIDAGGDIVVGAPPPGAAGWKIGVAPLDAPEGEPQRFLTLAHVAVATSGDAAQYIELDGVRYSHVLDPTTGLGLTTRSSVTVVAPDGITADAWATAVSVLGPERGLKLLESVDAAAAFLVVRDESGLRTYESPGFATLESGTTSPRAR